MLLSMKIRLKPTKEQEKLFWKSAGTARWAYNFYLSESRRHYFEYTQGDHKHPYIQESEVRKYINNTLKKSTHGWLKDIGCNVVKQAVRDADTAMKRYLRGISNKPRFKSRHQSKNSFYVNYETLRRTKNGFRGEKMKVVKTVMPLPKLKKGQKYSNPRISHDGNYWYLSISYPFEKIKVNLTKESLGIDVGVKDLAVCSNGKIYKNINNEASIKRLEKKLKREQRKLARKYSANIKDYTAHRKPIYKKPIYQMKNILKQKKIIRNLYKKLNDIRQNYLHQVSSEIVKNKPSRIVMENLNIKGMMKNKYLSKAIAQQKLYEFKRQIKYKSVKYGIEFVEASRWYPSSKSCSNCGKIKSKLPLEERIFFCECGLVINRDYNASINLANYSN